MMFYAPIKALPHQTHKFPLSQTPSSKVTHHQLILWWMPFATDAQHIHEMRLNGTEGEAKRKSN